MKVTANMLKAAVISHFRFKRQCVAVDEVGCSMGNCDVLADNGKQIVEIEIKITKSDLINGEKKKGRHPLGLPTQYTMTPNKFYICVPSELEEAALNWIEEIHPSYGLITFDQRHTNIFKELPHVLWGKYLHFARPAKKLHKIYRENIFRKISMRASASICAYIGREAMLYGNSTVAEVAS